ncbi:MAG TPA: chemotaxis protein CheX [Bryobacteraceae bacterium]|nr:chemotaxis protein CheX [Bryobacteraceae bacterium]
MPEQLDDTKMAGALRAATEEVFSTMLGIEVAAGEPYRLPSKPEPTNGVVALIGLTGKWVGTGSVFCTGDFARKISGQLLMSEFASIDQEVLDAIGEVTNMIVGSFKNSLEAEVGMLNMSIPVVVFGHNFTATSIHRTEWLVVPFECGSERLIVKACLAPQTEHQHRRAIDVHAPLSQVVV